MKTIYLFLAFIPLIISSCYSQRLENSIVLINVENLDRAGIAREIEIVNSLNPKVVAIDLQFDVSKNDDEKLINALWNCKSLVIASLIHNLGKDILISRASLAEFSPTQSKSGFINTLREVDEFKSLKRFIVQEQESMGDQRMNIIFPYKLL